MLKTVWVAQGRGGCRGRVGRGQRPEWAGGRGGSAVWSRGVYAESRVCKE